MRLKKRRGLYESRKISFVPVGDIRPNPDQPRKHFDADGLRELAASIARYGILQPLTVRRRGGGYELVSGERRLRASKLAGLQEVPCIVLDVDGHESSILALIENLQRKDLSFIEEAEALSCLIHKHAYKQEEVARLVGLSQSAVSNKLRLLRLPQDLLHAIEDVGLTERHARALLRLEDEEGQMAVFEQIVRRGLNVAATEELVDSYLAKKSDKPRETNKPLYVIKDVRIFLNTLSRSMMLMKQSGIQAESVQNETDKEIIVTIKIPKPSHKAEEPEPCTQTG
jgi:ParB family chromosome partitioning protein